MRILRVVLVILSALLIAAHYLREGTYPLVLLSLAFPVLLLVTKNWARWVVEALLILAAIEWVRTLLALISERQAIGQSYTAAAAILGGVAVLTAASAVVLELTSRKQEPRRNSS